MTALDLEAWTTGMDTYCWIVCPGFQPINLLVGYMYVSVTVNSDTESQRFNFYLQILKFQKIHRYVVGMFCTKYTSGRYQLLTYCT